MEFIALHSIFKDKSVIFSVPNYLNNLKILSFAINITKPVRSTIFIFNKIVTDMNIDYNLPDSRDCQNSTYLYPPAGHVITGNLNVIPDTRVCNIVFKDPKYRFPSNIDVVERSLLHLTTSVIVGMNAKMLNVMP